MTDAIDAIPIHDEPAPGADEIFLEAHQRIKEAIFDERSAIKNIACEFWTEEALAIVKAIEQRDKDPFVRPLLTERTYCEFARPALASEVDAMGLLTEANEITQAGTSNHGSWVQITTLQPSP